MSEQPESINVQRRRKGSGDGPSGRGEAPHRGDSGQGGGSSGGGGGGGLSLPGGKLGGCGSVVVIILFVIYYLITGGDGSSTDSQSADQGAQDTGGNPAEVLPTNTPRPTRVPSNATKSGETWLVMMYEDADDEVLEQDIYIDVNEAERVGSSDRVTIVAQIDRYKGAFKGDGNWTSTRRYLVQKDDDLKAIHSDMLDDLGETSMAQGQTLIDFATWGIKTYPADHYVLVLSDHGMGWPGGWTDPVPGSTDPGSAPLVRAIDGDMLYLSEIDAALGKIRQQTGIEKFDIVGMDACLMSQLEVYAALQPHARYAIASEETEPSLGWAYTAFLQALNDNPDMSAEQLSSVIVQTYIDKDQLIVDDQARKQFMDASASAARLAKQVGRDVTLTAVDLGALPDLMQRYNDFAYALQSEDQSAIASARNYAQSYTSIFGKEVPASFIDLGNFAQLAAKKIGSDALSQAVDKLMAALSSAIVAEKHGQAKPGSTGIAIYFPNSSLYRSPETGPQSYTKIADRFAKQSLWDDFLAFHYNDRSFKPDDAAPVVPGSGKPSRAPGAGGISISDIIASSDSITTDQPVKLSAEISGAKIGYIYLLIGLYDEQSNSIFLADTDYLESAETQNLGGIYYPQWPQKKFIMNYEWNVGLFEISDGSTHSLALFTPESYGASAADAAYTVEGTYTFADSGNQKYAQLFFQDGKLIKVMGYNGTQQTGAPAQITPTAGDTFTVFEKWLELGSDGAVSKTVMEDGETLTFGDTPFTWKEVYAPVGNYVVGFIVADNDGNQKASYANIVVK